MPFPFDTNAVVRPAALRFLEDGDGPLTGDQRLVVGADEDPGAETDGVSHHRLEGFVSMGGDDGVADRGAPAR